MSILTVDRFGQLIQKIPAMIPKPESKVTNYRVSIWARYPKNSYNGFGTFATIRWYVPYQLVPFFVGVDAQNCKIIRDIPDIVMLAGWLEDHSENSFDSIKAENFREGLRLLQTSLLPKTDLEKRLSNASN